MAILSSGQTRLAALCVLAVSATGFVAYAWHSPINPIQPPTAQAFDRRQIKRGADLAAIGNCNVCHTAPEGRTFAGGQPVPTPFGTIYSTNITPDRDTGIGRWSERAFIRVMREGIDRGGRRLYPAFPYDHFTLVSDDDRALYAFLMTREPISAATSPPGLAFPLNIRLMVAGWKLPVLPPPAL
ncbi:mono/diheme cytochrome c family protein [Bradyrhizobium sp. S3.2.6]